MNNVKYANPKTGLVKIVKVSQKLASLAQANRKMLKAGLYRSGIRAA